MEYITLDLVFWRKGRGKARFLINFIYLFIRLFIYLYFREVQYSIISVKNRLNKGTRKLGRK